MLHERRACVFGASGSGKSTLLLALANWAPPERVCWLVDPLDEHMDRLTGAGAVRFAPSLTGGLESAEGPVFDLVDDVAHAAYTRGGVVLHIDEADLACRGGGRVAPPWLVRLVMHGRHQQCGWVFATRRPAEIPRSLTSQANEYFVFRLNEPRDLQSVTDRGLNADVVKTLPVGAFLHWKPGQGEPHQHRSMTEHCKE